MRVLPRPRTVRRALLGLGLGVVAGWVYSLVQSPPPAPAAPPRPVPVPAEVPPTPDERAEGTYEEALEADPGSGQPVEAPPVAPEAPAAPPPEPETEVPEDVGAPVRTATSRARAKLTAATEALTEGDAAEQPAKKRPARASRARVDPEALAVSADTGDVPEPLVPDAPDAPDALADEA